MDKEAQEKIVVFLGIAQEAGMRGIYFDVWGNARTLLNELQKLGYRKLPKDKPPLLSDERIGLAKMVSAKELNEDADARYKSAAQAQDEAKIYLSIQAELKHRLGKDFEAKCLQLGLEALGEIERLPNRHKLPSETK